MTDRIDARSTGGDALVRSEAAKHRHSLTQVITWTAIVLIYAVAVFFVLDRLGVPVTGLVAPATVLGVGLGVWWLDGAAALFISLGIIWDGVRNTRAAVSDLVDRRGRTYDDRHPHPLIAQTMLRHEPLTGLYVPLRLMVMGKTADPSRGTVVVYDVPSSMIAPHDPGALRRAAAIARATARAWGSSP